MYLEDYGLGFAWRMHRTKTLQEMSFIVSDGLEVHDDRWRATYVICSWHGKSVGGWRFTAKPGEWEIRRLVKNTYPEHIKALSELYEVTISQGGYEYIVKSS
jgi:hypothetical protein